MCTIKEYSLFKLTKLQCTCCCQENDNYYCPEIIEFLKVYLQICEHQLFLDLRMNRHDGQEILEWFYFMAGITVFCFKLNL